MSEAQNPTGVTGPAGAAEQSPADSQRPAYVNHQQELTQHPGSFSDRVLHKLANELWRPSRSVASQTGPSFEWSVSAGLLSWLFSVCALALFNAIAWVTIAFYYSSVGRRLPTSDFASDPGVVLSSILSTLPAHALTLLFCWMIVTRMGKRPFLETLGWTWHEKFGPIHAVAFVLVMFVAGLIAGRLLPNAETPLEQVLRTSTAVRIAVASLAVLTAPIVEEVVYRGVLFGPLARRFGKVAAILSVSVLFAVVHVPQNWGGWATITALSTLSFGLTIVRASTDSVLPCFAIHTMFNAIASIFVILGKTNP